MDKKDPMENSAVVDLEAMDDDSDYEVNFSDPNLESERQAKQRSKDKTSGMMEDIQGEVTKNMTSYMIEAGKERAKKVFDIYGNIDILRPYFDVEPHEIRQRLIHSLIPQRPSADIKQKVHRELYGPLMIVFTLIALLLFQMKMSDHNVEEGTLMGSAFAVCFGYWFGIASLMWVLAYVCNAHITMLQILSLLGYALFGHCIVLFLGTVFHTSHDHAMFYLLWAVFGGLATVKMITVLISRTAGKTQKLILCGFVALTHLLFLLYLHFAYHKIVEELSSVIDKPVVPKMDVAHDTMDDIKLDNPVNPGSDAHKKFLNEDEKVNGVHESKRFIRSVNDELPSANKNSSQQKISTTGNLHLQREQGSNVPQGSNVVQQGSKVMHQDSNSAKTNGTLAKKSANLPIVQGNAVKLK